jgi:hypothetical protein
VGASMTRDGSVSLDRLLRDPVHRRIAAGVVIGICAVGWAIPAAAYRPFDGTDAAVADVGEVEIEFQPARRGRRLLAGPVCRRGSLNVRFAPKATKLLRYRELSRRANGRTSI